MGTQISTIDHLFYSVMLQMCITGGLSVNGPRQEKSSTQSILVSSEIVKDNFRQN